LGASGGAAQWKPAHRVKRAFGHGVGANEVLWTPDIVALPIFNAPPPAQRFFPTTRGEIGSHEKD
jgi:hypothetical protein